MPIWFALAIVIAIAIVIDNDSDNDSDSDNDNDNDSDSDNDSDNDNDLPPLTKNNMLQYMVIVTLPEEFSPRFVSLIPEQRAMVHEMMDEGVILNYSLSHNRNHLWITMVAKSEDEVHNHIARFPLARYMKANITELMFHHSAEFVMPEPSLN